MFIAYIIKDRVCLLQISDIDECETSNPCADKCIDKTPGYACSCTKNGTKLDSDEQSCTGWYIQFECFCCFDVPFYSF